MAMAACRKSPQPDAVANPAEKAAPVAVSQPPAAPASLPDACTILTSAEIEGALGEPIKETKLSSVPSPELTISQCYYRLPTEVNSVSLVVYGQGEKGRSPREVWKQTFGRDHEDDGDQEEKKTPPKKIDGVGDECFWTGNAIGGALYVLRGNAYLRISVGGAGDQDVKIKKSRALAELALAHLPTR